MAKTGARQPLSAVKNEARSPAKPNVPHALGAAISTLSSGLLREQLRLLCHEFPAVIPALEARLLVQGKDVVRYHVDTDSEDNADSEDESEDSGASESDAGEKSDSHRAESKMRKQIAKGDEEYTARMAMCENCKQEFDVSMNDRGDCVWHSGLKDVYHDSDFWADHDEDCHGPYESFEDDPDFAEGFIWDCCDKPGDGEGCKSTKHKAAVNIVVAAPLSAPSKKRKAQEEAPMKSVKKERK